MDKSATIIRMKKRILAFLESQGRECVQCEIYKKVVGRRDVIAKALSCLCDESAILCFGDGVRSDPRRYTINVVRQTACRAADRILIPQAQIESGSDHLEIFV
jgi:hypothetical protein